MLIHNKQQTKDCRHEETQTRKMETKNGDKYKVCKPFGVNTAIRVLKPMNQLKKTLKQSSVEAAGTSNVTYVSTFLTRDF